jgi:FtsP/CotA-like multicopper oxidase with cupredoxin domain
MNQKRSRPARLAAALVFLVAMYVSAGAATIDLEIAETRVELRPGLYTDAWTYGGSVPGRPIVVRPGELVTVNVLNRLSGATNVHWHGLQVPIDQDGPGVSIGSGQRFTYSFVPKRPGTYWYHPHVRPVLDQLDRGLYGSFIVADPIDARYSGDSVFVLDDWHLDASGRRLPGTGRGMMERMGNVETVNGKTGEAVAPLVVAAGELHKLRFINASTAAEHRLRVTGHRFRITHTDGEPLTEPYLVDEIRLSPGERVDAELAAVGQPGAAYEIASDRPGLGIRIPLLYREDRVPAVASPFVPPAPRGYPDIFAARPDRTLVLDSRMGSAMGSGMMGGMGGMGHGMHGSAASAGEGSSGMAWTINGASFPETEPIVVRVGKVVKLRLRNQDTGMMHPMDHPIHLHGTHFLIVSQNGRQPERETWKDTVSVPAGEYVDIAFVMENPGDWMLHCHIIDHEDGGMMTMVEAR